MHYDICNVTLPSGVVDTISFDDGRGVRRGLPSRHTIDGRGLLALPGWINLHVHDRTPGGESEDWEHLTQAGVAGGLTYLCKMPNTDPPIATAEQLERSCKKIGPAKIPYKVWFGATKDNRSEIELVARDQRICGVKLYLGSTTGSLLVKTKEAQRQIFRTCAALGLPVAVHAEDEELMRTNRRLLGRQPLLTDHCLIRATPVAVEGTRRALRLARAEECALHVCHVSTPEEVELIDAARQAGQNVTCEVAPHHLFLDETMLRRSASPGFYKMNPPLRTVRQKQLLLRYLCRPGLVDAIADDHAPHDWATKQLLQYDQVPSGVPGVQTTLPLLLTLVAQGQMLPDHLAALLSANPARIARLPTKGKLPPAGDADFVLCDLAERWTITHAAMLYKCGWTPFHGLTVQGAIKLVVINGQIVWNRLSL